MKLGMSTDFIWVDLPASMLLDQYWWIWVHVEKQFENIKTEKLKSVFSKQKISFFFLKNLPVGATFGVLDKSKYKQPNKRNFYYFG